MSSNLGLLASRIGEAKRLTILTGAGVSAASGVPTFRGQDGLWRHYRPEDLATPEAFGRDPRLVWEWYGWRRELIAACRPNAAHDVIARWSRRPGCQVLTQNVDDLHLRAGTRSLVRIHGSIWELSCWDACAEGATPWRDERVPLPDLPPRCPHCDGTARPAVVWFGESLRTDDLRAALHATACDLFLAVGTSAVVYPAAGLVHEARSNGAFTAEINLEPTPASAAVNLAIQGAAEDVLPLIAARMSAG
jgi:NAD-dependent protein deacetylase/lipoamidase